MFNPYQSDNFTFENQFSETALTQALSFSLDADLRTLYSPLTISAGVESGTVNPPSSALAAQTQFIPLDIDAPTAETTGSSFLDFSARVLVLNGTFNVGDVITAGTTASLSDIVFRDFDSGGGDLGFTDFSGGADADTRIEIVGVDIGAISDFTFNTFTVDTLNGTVTGAGFVFAGQTYVIVPQSQTNNFDFDDVLDFATITADGSVSAGATDIATGDSFNLREGFNHSLGVFAETIEDGTGTVLSSGIQTLNISSLNLDTTFTSSPFEQIFRLEGSSNIVLNAAKASEGTVTISTANGLIADIRVLRVFETEGDDTTVYLFDRDQLSANSLNVNDILGVSNFTAGDHDAESLRDDFGAFGLGTRYVGTAGDDVFDASGFGFNQDFVFIGGAGDDSFIGSRGDNIFIADAGADSYDGFDSSSSRESLVDYSQALTGITVFNDGVTAGIGDIAQGDILTRINSIIGSDFDDNLNLFTHDLDQERILAGDGDDVIVLDATTNAAFGFNGRVAFLDGGTGSDTLRVQSNESESFSVNNFNGIETIEFNTLSSGVSLSLTIQRGSSDIFSGGTINIRGVDEAGSVETLSLSSSISAAAILDFSGLVFTDWGGQGETVRIILDGDEDQTVTGTSVDDIIFIDRRDIGDHVIDGSTGSDTLSFAVTFFSAPINVDLNLSGTAQNTGHGILTITGIENLAGGAGDDTLTGDNLANIISGGSGNDTIDGGSGNDTVNGGFGNDTIDGGGGNDTVSYINAFAAVTVDLSITIAQDTLGAGIDTLANFENLTGGDFDDILLGDAQDNIINGGDGNDTTVYSGNLANYTITRNSDDSLTVTDNVGMNGTDTLANVEFLEFD